MSTYTKNQKNYIYDLYQAVETAVEKSGLEIICEIDKKDLFEELKRGVYLNKDGSYNAQQVIDALKVAAKGNFGVLEFIAKKATIYNPIKTQVEVVEVVEVVETQVETQVEVVEVVETQVETQQEVVEVVEVYNTVKKCNTKITFRKFNKEEIQRVEKNLEYNQSIQGFRAGLCTSENWVWSGNQPTYFRRNGKLENCVNAKYTDGNTHEVIFFLSNLEDCNMQLEGLLNEWYWLERIETQVETQQEVVEVVETQELDLTFDTVQSFLENTTKIEQCENGMVINTRGKKFYIIDSEFCSRYLPNNIYAGSEIICNDQKLCIADRVYNCWEIR